MPDITVIVPVYNVEWYLEECLDSLIAQTYKNIEFLCIDDGSSDSSPDILKRYAAKDSRIRVITKKNEGYGKTMNRGLELATSPWIGIVESDDFVKAGMYETLFAASLGSGADIIKCNFYKYKTKEGKDTDHSREYPERLLDREICPLEEPEIYDAHSSIWAGIYRRSFLEKHHIRFQETPGASYQDISFHFKALSEAGRIKIVKDALIYYRTDNVNSSVYDPKKIHCVLDEMHIIEAYIKEQSEERQACLWPVFTRKKFYDYRWNYMRLLPEFQHTFLKRMSEEFRADYEKGRFENIRWISESNRKELLEIMNDPLSFFVRTENKNYVDERVGLVGTVNRKIYRKGLLQEIKESKRTLIYGAGVRGKWVVQRLLENGISPSKLLFVVSRKGPEEEAMGIAVEEIGKIASGQEGLFVIVAVKKETQTEMLGNLQRLGFENIVLTDEEFTQAMEHSGS